MITIGKFLAGTLAAQFLFVVTKLIFIQYLNMDSVFFIGLFWLVLCAIAIAIVRRIGVLNYFEDFFIAVVWIFLSLIIDLAITTAIVGRDVYTTWYFWLSYLFVIIAVVVFHKKAHVELRHQIKRQRK